MQFTFFHLMPYRPLDMAERAKHTAAWVVLPNNLYDPKKGADEYQSYIDQLVYAEKLGFMTLVSDGERLTGAHALGPDAGEWLQQATLAIRSRVPISVMNDTIQPFPTFSEAFLPALEELTARAAGSSDQRS